MPCYAAACRSDSGVWGARVLKSVALTIPRIRQLHAHRDTLLARVAELETAARVAAERDAERIRGRDAAARDATQLELQLSAATALNADLQASLGAATEHVADLETALHQSERDRGLIAEELAAVRGQHDALLAGQRRFEEQEVCRGLTARSVFILGFGRSSTSVTLHMLNTAPNALLLGEANLFQRNDAARFRDWYNTQHVNNGGQAAKSTYAPDFIPDRDHTWWEWLQAAATHYDVIGDKMALSSYHFSQADPERIRSFFEARFFDARYIFLIRNPVDTLISIAKLFQIEDDSGIARECDAWLRYIQMWADWVRNFPRTLTMIADDFGPHTAHDLSVFTGLDVMESGLLVDHRLRTRHEIPARFPTVATVRMDLMGVFDLARAALAENRVYWQAPLLRRAAGNALPGNGPEDTATLPRALGQVWARAEALREALAAKRPYSA